MKQTLFAMTATLLLIATSVWGIKGGTWEGSASELDEPNVPVVNNIAKHYNAQRVLAILAHPDDEQFAISLLYQARKAGSQVALITATHGENGRIPNALRGEVSQQILGSTRTREVKEVGRLIGLTGQEIWDFPDNGLGDVSRSTLNSAVRNGLCRYQPELLVTFDPNSGYTGHRDHRRIGLASVEMATQLAANPCENGYRGPSLIAYPLTPKAGYTRHASARGRLAAERAAPANLAMPAPAWLRLAGWKIHRTQDNPLVRSFGMSEKELYARWTKEYYQVFDPAKPASQAAPEPNARR